MHTFTPPITGKKSALTVVLTNWKRVENMHLILDSLSEQSAQPTIYLWNNGEELRHPAIDWHIHSSQNALCWPRWFVASMAYTPYVLILDDDLLLTDAQALERGIAYMNQHAHIDICGLFGMTISQGTKYTDSPTQTVVAEQDTFVDIVKGRFVLLRTSALAALHLHPSPPRDVLMSEDILVSGALGKNRTTPHVLPSVLAGTWRNLEEPHALSHETGHWEQRELAMQQAFPHRL